MDRLNWRKASYSGSGGGNCVEVANAARAVAVRDTTARAAGTLLFTPSMWHEFTEGLKDGAA